MFGGTVLIQDTMGEKVGKFIQLLSTFISGFVIAFVSGWLLSLVLLACIPVIFAAAGVLSFVTSKMAARRQIAYAKAGNVVEQTVGAIRTPMMSTYGTPYAAIYSPGGVYAHPAVPLGSSPAQGVTSSPAVAPPLSMEKPTKSTGNSDQVLMKKLKRQFQVEMIS